MTVIPAGGPAVKEPGAAGEDDDDDNEDDDNDNQLGSVATEAVHEDAVDAVELASGVDDEIQPDNEAMPIHPDNDFCMDAPLAL